MMPTTQTDESKRQIVSGSVLIFIIVLAAYLPALLNGFIWDDDDHLTQNPCIVGPWGFKGIWTSSAAVYYPLVLTSFWIQHALWGLNPLPYHFVNIVVHALCCVVLWRVLLRLNVPGAWLGALLWAIHPVQVESVAWITELKNTQSGFFFLLAILFYLRWHTSGVEVGRSERIRNYALVLVCAALAILSKPSTVMLPVVLGLSAWWVDGRWRWRNIPGLIPLVLISAAASGWTVWEQKFHSGALGEEWNQSLLERVAIAGRIIWFYLGKLAWPHPLIFIYPRWNVDSSRLVSFLPALAVVLALGLLWWRRNGPLRPAFFASSYFAVSLFPVLGFFNIYFFRYSYVGDHFQYLASMAPLTLAGAMVANRGRWLERFGAHAAAVVQATVVVALGVLTWSHTTAFRSDETLWRDTIAKNPGTWLAQNNLGTIFFQRNELQKAISQYELTLQLHPRYPEGHANLANALVELGRTNEAIEHYRVALQLNPRQAAVHNCLGSVLAEQGNLDEAVQHFEAALQSRKTADLAMAHGNLGSIEAMRGRFDSAIAHFTEAIQINPLNPKTRMNLANALASQGKYEEAIRGYKEVLQVAPNEPVAYAKLGVVMGSMGRTNEALFYFREARRLAPNLPQLREQIEALEGPTGQ